ncbi:MAG TPA: TIM barrel protein [Chthoniobacteraceae bacterium]|nr:TIM barrel protein [Chthoniobacteraceae bacterium]
MRRFVFLSDAHSTAPLAPIQQRVAQGCGRKVREAGPDVILLGGDLTHRPETAQADAFLEAFAVRDFPLYYLPGNNEGDRFCYPAGVTPVASCVELEGGVWLLPTANGAQARESVDALLERLPEEGSALVFAHFPPFIAGEERLKRLEASSCRIHWICGHRHQAHDATSGSLRVTLCAGLDPVKVRGSLPEWLAVEWDGATAQVRREGIPSEVLNPQRQPIHRAGLAFRGTGEQLLRLALERKIPAIQFHYHHSAGLPTETERELAGTFREKLPGGFLSLHLPNFPHPEEGPDLADQEASLQFAEAMGLDDLTIHLPNVRACTLFRHDGTLQESEWARGCIATYVALAARAIRMGAQISFENVYNKAVKPAGEERLASRPWHLLRFVEAVRAGLREEGFSSREAERVGIIFDAGHAFADVQMGKYYGLADWLVQVAPYLQLLHVHQVTRRPDGEGTVNHQPISEGYGPLINYHGFLSALGDVCARPLCLLVEVREREAALLSYATLRESGLLRPD